MKVLHINFSKIGGSGTFALDLASAQNHLGVNAELETLIDSDLRAEPLKLPLLTLEAIADEYMVKNPNFPSPISLFRAGDRFGRSILSGNPDLIHLHWVQGVVNLDWLYKTNLPIVWTLHDFRPISGACHHPLGCEHLSNNCGDCPAVRTFFRSAVHSAVKRRLDQGAYDKISFVAPSRWVASVAEGATSLKGRELPVIHNASSDDFLIKGEIYPKELLDSKAQPIVAIAFGTSPSPLKGRGQFETLDPEIFKGHRVISFGAERLRWADLHLGVISRAQVRSLFSMAKLVIIPSIAETFSLAAFEATQVGTPVCAIPGGAVEEISREYGQYIPLEGDEILKYLTDSNQKVERIVRRDMLDVAREYIDFYNKVLSGQGQL